MTKKTDTNIVKGYVRYLKLERNFSQNTLDAYLNDLRKLLDFVERRDLDVLTISLEDLENFSAQLHSRGSRRAHARCPEHQTPGAQERHQGLW